MNCIQESRINDTYGNNNESNDDDDDCIVNLKWTRTDNNNEQKWKKIMWESYHVWAKKKEKEKDLFD